MTQRTRRAVRIRDVADRALVSIGTVSRVINNHPSVETELRMRVLSAVKELGYVHRPRLQESAPDSGHAPVAPARKLDHIAFCCRSDVSPRMDPAFNPYFSLVLQGAEAECRRLGIQLTYRIIEDEMHELPGATDLLSRSRAEALLLLNFTNRALVQGLIDLGLPAVLVDHSFADLALDTVLNDSYGGALLAVNYLLGQGHRRIAFVDGLPHATIERRYDGYHRALTQSGITPDPTWILPGNLRLDGGQRAGEEFVRRGLDCTAVFCANDSTAFGFIQSLADHGLRVPHHVSVVGFDDIEASRLISPALTTIRASAPDLGRMAVRRLIERVDDPTVPITQTLVHTELVERRSVKRINS
jgi:LacI family transcriptional regulator